MAVELRCPDCRAKLRLPSDPEPGTEVECPECGAVFAAPDPDTGEAPDRRGKSAGKKRPAGDDDRPAKKSADEGKPKPAGGKKAAADQPKMRKAKKKETNKSALIAIIAGVILFLVMIVGLLVWFFTKKPVPFEMLGYLPDDCSTATGLNIGHMVKYSEFIKVVEPSYRDNGLKRAADALSKALGGDANELIDFMLIGSGKSGSGVVLRTKKEFDPGLLNKLPGARQGTAGGQTYYTIAGIDKLWAGTTQELRVFAPTNRLVVLCPAAQADATFQRMVGGNRDDFDKTIPGRFGPLAKRITRGTYWHITTEKVTAPEKNNLQDATGGAFMKQAAETTSSSTAWGFKASLGSRAIRFEVDVMYKDAEAAADWYKKFKENDIAKGDEVEPPKFWKDFDQTLVSNRKAGRDLLSNLGAKSSGDLFIIYSECDTRIMMESIGSLANKLAGQQGFGPMMGMGMGGGGPPGGGAQPPGGPPGTK